MTEVVSGSVHPNNRPSPGPIGNTQGLILPETSPNASGAGNSAPPPEEKSWWQRWGSDAIHVGLDVVGLIPVVGEVADGANALIYLAEGDKVNAALSAASMLPVGGQAATAAKWGKKGIDAAQSAKTAAKAGAEAAVKTGRETAEHAAKETAETAAEKGAKSADNAAGGGHVKKNPKPLREEYLGKTPGKNSRTGKEVQERMRKEGTLRDGPDGPEFKASNGRWYPLKDADMSHSTDAVKWWNETGRQYGAKSKEVRDWMLDSKNYKLDHYGINRSAGAKLPDRYLPPLK